MGSGRSCTRSSIYISDGPLILNGGYDRNRAEAAISAGAADAAAFGTPFIANPDLVDRLRLRLPLAAPDPDTFYTPGAAGYTDYPAHSVAA